MKIAIVGANGQLGRCLQDVLALTKHEVHAFSRNDLDITVQAYVYDLLSSFSPEVVINAAAYTAVDRAEEEPEHAYRINEGGAANLAVFCAETDAVLIHISTDYVFSGEKTVPYHESDPSAPLGVYGASKLAGEEEVVRLCPRHLIVRVAWLFSEYGSNFFLTMLRLAQSHETLRIVADQYGTPTYAGDLARALVVMAERSHDANKWGVYHYSGGEKCSWCEFAREIFQQAILVGKVKTHSEVIDISTAEYPTLAKRPSYSVLSGSLLQDTFDIFPGDWQKAIKDIL